MKALLTLVAFAFSVTAHAAVTETFTLFTVASGYSDCATADYTNCTQNNFVSEKVDIELVNGQGNWRRQFLLDGVTYFYDISVTKNAADSFFLTFYTAVREGNNEYRESQSYVSTESSQKMNVIGTYTNLLPVPGHGFSGTLLQVAPAN